MLLRDLSNNNGLEAGLKEIADPATSAFYFKATEGLGFLDRDYPIFRRAAAARGVPSGAYLFLHHDESGVDQVRRFLAYANIRPGDLQPVVDVEHGSAALSAHVAYQALSVLKAAGFDPILYTSTSWLPTLLKIEHRIGQFRVWQAEYGPVLHRIPGFRVIAWQFTDRLIVGKGPLRTDGSHIYVRSLSALEYKPVPKPAPVRRPADELKKLKGFRSWAAWRLGVGPFKGWGRANKAVRPHVPRVIDYGWWQRFRAL